jgi:hypothetical protein
LTPGHTRRVLAGWIVVAAAAAVGCQTNEITSVWQAPDVPSGGFRSVMVIGFARTEDLRNYFESNFARDLKEVGVKGISSASVLPEPSKQLTRETVLAWVRDQGVEAVLTTRLINTDRQTREASLGGDLYSERGPRSWHVPTEEVTFTTFHLETRLYEASSGRLVFRAASATGNPVSPGSVALAVIDAMIGELSERRILAARLP